MNEDRPEIRFKLRSRMELELIENYIEKKHIKSKAELARRAVFQYIARYPTPPENDNKRP